MNSGFLFCRAGTHVFPPYDPEGDMVELMIKATYYVDGDGEKGDDPIMLRDSIVKYMGDEFPTGDLGTATYQDLADELLVVFQLEECEVEDMNGIGGIAFAPEEREECEECEECEEEPGVFWIPPVFAIVNEPSLEGVDPNVADSVLWMGAQIPEDRTTWGNFDGKWIKTDGSGTDQILKKTMFFNMELGIDAVLSYDPDTGWETEEPIERALRGI